MPIKNQKNNNSTHLLSDNLHVTMKWFSKKNMKNRKCCLCEEPSTHVFEYNATCFHLVYKRHFDNLYIFLECSKCFIDTYKIENEVESDTSSKYELEDEPSSESEYKPESESEPEPESKNEIKNKKSQATQSLSFLSILPASFEYGDCNLKDYPRKR
jgi:hypothetical protein